MNATEPTFVPGLRLNRIFYFDTVRPLINQHFPGLVHSAALVGYGSDVLGYDTLTSTDHNWGPRLQLFLSPQDHASLATQLHDMFSTNLPPTVEGYSTHFTQPDLADSSTQRMQPYTGGPIEHLIKISTVDQFFTSSLGIALDTPLTAYDWLALPEQKLLEVTAGEVFHDGLQTLGTARARFAYYPQDIWKVRLAAQWQRISEEEAFVGRTGDLGDEVGSWLIASRLVRDIMKLAFLYARHYAPYSKWFGTALSRLAIATDLLPHIQAMTTASDWHSRETHLIALYQRLAIEHNHLSITTPISASAQNYFGRPYQVIFASRFAKAINETITDPALQKLAQFGAVDQFTDCVAIHSNGNLAASLKSIYRPDS